MMNIFVQIMINVYTLNKNFKLIETLLIILIIVWKNVQIQRNTGIQIVNKIFAINIIVIMVIMKIMIIVDIIIKQVDK